MNGSDGKHRRGDSPIKSCPARSSSSLGNVGMQSSSLDAIPAAPNEPVQDAPLQSVEASNTETQSTQEQTTSSSHHDDDAEKPTPYSIFTQRQVAIIVGLASWSASFSGLSSNIYFPAISIIATDLNVTPEAINLTVTLYLIFQGLSPSLWAPLSDTKGRRIIILITFTLYLAANIGLALTRDYAQLAILRAVQSSGSASTVAIGSAIVADVADRHERAGYMGIFQASSLIATAVGPVIGAAVAQKENWRDIFWLLVGYGAAFLIIAAVIYPETLRKLVGNGEIVPTSEWFRVPIYAMWVPAKEQHKATKMERLEIARASAFPVQSVLRPLLLCKHASVSLSVMFLALHYAVWQMTLVASSTFFARQYGLDVLQVGLTFISNGAGCIAASVVYGRLLDRIYAVIAKNHAEKTPEKPFLIARARLVSSPILSLVEVAFVIVFGWTIDKHVHISVPIICVFFIAASLLGSQVAVSTFLVDSFPNDSGSANATLNLFRCLFAAGGTAAILPMTDGMGTGWAFTFLALVLIASNACIVILLFIERRQLERA